VRSITFPYTRFGGRFAPIIPVTLFTQSLTFKTEAYVDSDAFCSVFQSEILEVLQLPKEQAQTKTLKAADENLIPAYLFRLPVQIADIRLRATIAFSDKLKIGFNLLGRQTIFNAFEEIAFNEREKKVILRYEDR
jgi:hypothetical protein